MLIEHVGEHYCVPRLPKILAWVGGKYQLVRELCRRIPPHRTYVEPFAGGASLFFGKRPSGMEVLADSDCALIDFYRAIRELSSLDGITRFGWAKSRETFERLRECVGTGQCDSDDPTYRAYAFLYVNKYGYGGMREKAPYNPRKQGDKECSQEQLCGIKELYRKWDGVRRRLQQAKLECADFRETLARHDSPTTFFYLDPPFPRTAEGFYKETEVAPREVARALAQTRGKWMLSYPDAPPTWNLFRGYNIERVHRRKEVGAREGGRERVTELLITNYRIEHE